MVFRRPAAILAITGALLMGGAAAALADTATGQGLAVDGSACSGPVAVAPGQSADETGSAVQAGTDIPASVRWSIWSSSTPNYSNATRAVYEQGSSVGLAVENTGTATVYYWGCLWNNSSGPVDFTVSINES
jgi:hypothetical protein